MDRKDGVKIEFKIKIIIFIILIFFKYDSQVKIVFFIKKNMKETEL